MESTTQPSSAARPAPRDGRTCRTGAQNARQPRRDSGQLGSRTASGSWKHGETIKSESSRASEAGWELPTLQGAAVIPTKDLIDRAAANARKRFWWKVWI